ncbi:hypothetical protein ACFLY6_01805 [Candidatus Dependentiae bacterium]
MTDLLKTYFATKNLKNDKIEQLLEKAQALFDQALDEDKTEKVAKKPKDLGIEQCQ